MSFEAAQDLMATVALRLVDRIRSYGPVAVAFSGGVDSAVVARAAVEAWPGRAIALTAVSPSLAASEREIARREAAAIGIRHEELMTMEFDRPEYRRNAGNRCYYCKDTLYELAASQLQRLEVSGLVNGANMDDLGDHRPGMDAAREHRVFSPLIEEGLGKAGVRALARWWQLSVAEKPAAPCLSSRIAYGVEVTPERVARVEQAEQLLAMLTGIAEFRVRVEAAELARIEVPLKELRRLTDETVREQLVRGLRQLGFRRITLDLEGFRSGSLNDLLPILTEG